MNHYFLILKGCNKKLAILEFENLFEIYNEEKITLKLIENSLYHFKSKNKIKKKILTRLTFTNYIGIKKDEMTNPNKINLKKKDLLKYENKKVRLRIKKSKRNLEINYNEKELSKNLIPKLNLVKVSLENPDIEFNYVFYENQEKLILLEKIFENDKDYLNRMPKLRPIAMPYTLKSDMARASINLLNIKKGIVLDPFCGIGGILLEAKDMGFQIIGNDISWNDLKYFKKNLSYFFPKAKAHLILTDASKQFLKENSIDGIVSDIPYGKSSRLKGNDLYEKFLKSSQKYLKKGKRIIIIYANFVEFKELALKYFKEIDEIEEYINKSLTRYILILEKE
jgi:putative methyltransferase (TIGR01177 family)